LWLHINCIYNPVTGRTDDDDDDKIFGGKQKPQEIWANAHETRESL